MLRGFSDDACSSVSAAASALEANHTISAVLASHYSCPTLPDPSLARDIRQTWPYWEPDGQPVLAVTAFRLRLSEEDIFDAEAARAQLQDDVALSLGVEKERVDILNVSGRPNAVVEVALRASRQGAWYSRDLYFFGSVDQLPGLGLVHDLRRHASNTSHQLW
jgi:hypothetical protein